MSHGDDGTTNISTNGTGGTVGVDEEGNERTLHFQWPIRRAPKFLTYDRALSEWLDDLAADGNPDTRLTIREFKRQINQADRYRERWEKTYYAGRSTVIMLAAAVTALASASTGISGTAGLVIKIVTAALSFIVATTTGVLELLRTSNRWALYRILRNNLFQAAWQLNQPTAHGTDSKTKAEVLKKKLGEAVNEFEHQYLVQVFISEKTPDSGHGSPD